MSIMIGVLTGLIAIVASVATLGEGEPSGFHRWGPWIAVAAGLVAMAVAS